MMDQYIYPLLSKAEPFIFSTYFRAGFTIFSFFLIVVMMGMVRKHYFKLTMKGAKFGFIMGIIFVLFIEIALAILISFGPKGLGIVPKNIGSNALLEQTREGVGKINKVLGVTTCSSGNPTATSLLEQLPNLSIEEENKVRRILCR